MIVRWLRFLIGAVWTLPLALVALLLLPYCTPREVRRSGAVLEIYVSRLIGFVGTVGQTFGVVVLYRFPLDEVHPGLRRHEHAHARQALCWGPLFALAYGLECLIAWLRGRHWYWDNRFEVAARRAERAP